MPPSTTMARIEALSLNVKLSGLMKPAREADQEIGGEREHQDDEIEIDDALLRRIGDAEEIGEAVARGQRQAEEGRPGYAGNAVGAAGEARPVEQDDADDLAEAERDDGEIIAAQP
jgi:hypothetical protein